MRTWVRALGFVVVVAGCSSSSSAQTADSGGSPEVGSPQRDGASADAEEPVDVTASNDDAEGSDDAGADATTASPDAASATQGCFVVSGSGASQRCAFTTLADGGTCAVDAGAAGSCPSANLEGCCLKYATAGDTTDYTATCYYSSPDAGQSAESTCEAESYQDDGQYAWDTTLP